MATLTLKDIPAELHATLRRRAELHGRSLNREILTTLEAATKPHRPDPEVYLDRIRHLRQRAQLHVTQKEIERAIAEGRQ